MHPLPLAQDYQQTNTRIDLQDSLRTQIGIRQCEPTLSCKGEVLYPLPPLTPRHVIHVN